MSIERKRWIDRLLRHTKTLFLGCGAVSIGIGTVGAFAANDTPPALVSTTGGGGAKWTTVAELIAAAGKGDPLACYQYAQLLEGGSPANQVAKDAAKALEFYEKSAAAEHGPALFRLGKIYGDGLAGVTADYPRAFDYYQKAARRGIAEGQYNVGAMLVSGRGVKRDYVEGLAWLLVAKKRGAEAGPGIDQVRKRLEKTPQRIAAAEARAVVLEEELKSPAPIASRPAIVAPAVSPPARIQSVETPTPRPSSVPVETPAIKPPKLELPPPPPGKS